MTRFLPLSAALATALLLSACAAGPDYKRPAMVTPASYKELGDWKKAQPADTAPRGPWWSVYNDPALDRLERAVAVDNQNLKASEAAYRQAAAAVDEARAQFFPEIDLDATAQRSQPLKKSGGTTASSGTGVVSGNGSTVVATNTGTSSRSGSNRFTLSGNATWEPDLWGRIRRTVEAQQANAQASAADLASATLSIQGTLAVDYFQLRATDALRRMLDETVAFDRRSLKIVQNQYNAGIVGKSDLVQAQSLVDTVESQAINTGIVRAQLEHAIAVLTGQPPQDFALPPVTAKLAAALPDPPAIPVGVPSTLLERQPDIAAAERRAAAANAQIGVAESAWYPDLTLSATDVFSGAALGKLLNASNNVWTVGPQLAYTLFDGGATRAQIREARAAYDQQAALYRQAVLNGFQNVEDQLAALNILQKQSKIQDRAVNEAQQSVQLILNQYKAGTVVYTNVVTVQTQLLNTMQNALTLRENRLTASVQLIEALGGGWQSAH